MNGAAGAIYPEDYNESGSMWDHLERNKIDFYNFGFSVMFEPAFYNNSYKYTGIKHMFTGTPDLTPYNALAPDIRIFDPQKALSPLDEKFDWNSLDKSPLLDDPREMVKDQKEKAEYRTGDQKRK